MPKLTTSKLFVKDVEALRSNTVLIRRIAKTLALLEENPLHPGLHIERIINDPTAWSVRLDKRYRVSLEPELYYKGGNPHWSGGILLLRILDHDDLYKHPR
ncbi:MAG TPA: hypothetical protein VMX95_03100 [Thermodesulfobacteriota bacterium]|nr:hypothetical protein [Thermodesulfobacteriota bacterium]